jgi:hypothetical protein
MKTPVLIMAYRRDDMLQELLFQLPLDREIYIHIDGPRENTKRAVARCNTIAANFARFHPQATIKIFSQKRNLGNKKSFHACMKWVFNSQSQVIVLEEDIRFSQSFFAFMDWALTEFRDYKRIFHVNGFSVLDPFPGRNRLFESYSCRPWGFGTWKDRWLLHERSIPDFDLKSLRSLPIFASAELSPSFEEKWLNRFSRLKEGNDTYDVGWNYSAWKNNAFALAPRFSYVTNIGFDKRSLHTNIKPWFLRSPKKLRKIGESFKRRKIVPFPSPYDAYSDFVEWKVPGISSGSARILIFLYYVLLNVRNFLMKTVRIILKN